jgi:hypothetical protein
LADETKTKEQLLAEIAALEKALGQPTSGPGQSVSPAAAEPVAPEPRTRRGALGWIAPVILSIGAAAKIGQAQTLEHHRDDFVGPIGSCKTP